MSLGISGRGRDEFGYRDYFTLRGLVAELAGRGLNVDYRSVWEIVHAAKPSFKMAPLRGWAPVASV